MAARTVPTMPDWTAGQRVLASQLQSITTYSRFWTSRPMFSMYQGTPQTVGSGAFTQITMDTSDWDTDTGRSGTTPFSYTIPVGMGGRWTFSWKVGWAANAVNTRLESLYKNGSAVPMAQSNIQALTTAARTSDVAASTKTIVVAAGDVMSVWGFQDSGGNLATDSQCYFEGSIHSLASP